MADEAAYSDFSAGVRAAFHRLSGAGSVSAGAIALELQKLHPDYGDGQFGEAEIDPSSGPTLEIAEWADLVRSRYDAREVRASKHGVIDTHLALLALAHLDESLAASLSAAGAVGGLRSGSELRPRRPTTRSHNAEGGASSADPDFAERLAGPDIFLSYAREDEEWAAALANALGERGWSVFWDRNTPVGKRWEDVIEEQLRAADCVVVLWSDSSIGSRWVGIEASEAREQGKLVPCLISDVRPPLAHRDLQAADLTGWNANTPNSEFNALVAAVALQIGKPPESTNVRGRGPASVPTTRQETGDHAGKYRALWSRRRRERSGAVGFTFREIEQVLGFSLPPSSRKYVQHWRSYGGSAVARAIQDAGWSVTQVNLDCERVSLARVGSATSRSPHLNIAEGVLRRGPDFKVVVPAASRAGNFVKRRTVHLDNVYIVNRRARSLNLRFDLVCESTSDLGPQPYREIWKDAGEEVQRKYLSNPLHVDGDSHRDGHLAFVHDDPESILGACQRLRVTDEQTDSVFEFSIPTGEEGFSCRGENDALQPGDGFRTT